MPGLPTLGGPPLLRHVARSALLLGALGAVCGLVIGLRAHPATAWAAAFELGLPATALGMLVGLAVGLVAGALDRRRGGRASVRS
jgi:ABC-type antimicrobial peptide transport system permease subunit